MFCCSRCEIVVFMEFWLVYIFINFDQFAMVLIWNAFAHFSSHYKQRRLRRMHRNKRCKHQSRPPTPAKIHSKTWRMWWRRAANQPLTIWQRAPKKLPQRKVLWKSTIIVHRRNNIRRHNRYTSSSSSPLALRSFRTVAVAISSLRSAVKLMESLHRRLPCSPICLEKVSFIFFLSF